MGNNDNGIYKNGLKAEYFNNVYLQGNPVLTRIDDSINFSWTLYSPGRPVNHDFYSAKWTGLLKAPQSGTYKIGLDGNDGFRLYINNEMIIDNWQKQTYSTKLADYHFEKGKEYNIRVEFFEPVDNGHIRLIWNVGVANDWENKI